MSWVSKALKSVGSALGGGMSGGLLGGLGSGLLGGAFSFLDGANDYYWNRKNMDYQARLQDEYNMKYWNLQNAYNSPAAQMQRFREAGLNPNLIYGQTNMAGDIGSVSASAVGHPSPIAGNILMREQVRNMRSQNENLVAQNDNLKEQARALRIDNNLRENAGPLADAPWYFRLLFRSLPKDKNGDLSLPRLSSADIKAMMLGAMSGGMSVPMSLFNPVYNPGSLPPVGHLIYGDKGVRK